MRCVRAPFILALAIIAMAQPLTAQLVNLTDNRTPEQKWARTTLLVDFAWMVGLAHAESQGISAEEFGHWAGEWGAKSWGEPGRSLASFVRSMFMNYNLWSGLEFEILEESETEIRGRFNPPFEAVFTEEFLARYGVPVEDFQKVWLIMYEESANHLGFDMTHEIQGDWIEFTVKTRD